MVAPDEVVHVPVEGLAHDPLHDGLLVFPRANAAPQRITRAPDRESPVSPIGQWFGPNDPTAPLFPMPHSGFDAVHRTQPCQLSNQMLAHRGDLQLTFDRRVAIAARQAFKIGEEIWIREGPHLGGDMLAVAPVAAEPREEPAKRGGVIDQSRGMVRSVLDLRLEAESLAHELRAIVD